MNIIIGKLLIQCLYLLMELKDKVTGSRHSFERERSLINEAEKIIREKTKKEG